MIGHLGNPTGEQRNLDFRRARVTGSASKFTLQLLFPLFRKLHDVSRLHPLPAVAGLGHLFLVRCVPRDPIHVAEFARIQISWVP